jgi:hypothetical protein
LDVQLTVEGYNGAIIIMEVSYFMLLDWGENDNYLVVCAVAG